MKKKERQPITCAELDDLKNYLSGYKLCKELLQLEQYEREFIEDGKRWENERPGDLSLARARMFEIRQFILFLPNTKEKILLYMHYIDCEPIEKCGDIMNISRSSAFRLKRRALRFAFDHFNAQKSAKKLHYA